MPVLVRNFSIASNRPINKIVYIFEVKNYGTYTKNWNMPRNWEGISQA